MRQRLGNVAYYTALTAIALVFASMLGGLIYASYATPNHGQPATVTVTVPQPGDSTP